MFFIIESYRHFWILWILEVCSSYLIPDQLWRYEVQPDPLDAAASSSPEPNIVLTNLKMHIQVSKLTNFLLI